MSKDTASNPILDRIRAFVEPFNTRHQAVVATTLDGRIVYWNSAANRIYGWREEEVLGRDILEVTPSRVSQETAAEIMERLRAGAIWTGQFQVRHRDGEEFMALVRDVPVRDP